MSLSDAGAGGRHSLKGITAASVRVSLNVMRRFHHYAYNKFRLGLAVAELSEGGGKSSLGSVLNSHS